MQRRSKILDIHVIRIVPSKRAFMALRASLTVRPDSIATHASPHEEDVRCRTCLNGLSVSGIGESAVHNYEVTEPKQSQKLYSRCASAAYSFAIVTQLCAEPS